MASTLTTIYANNTYGRGTGSETFTMVWAGGTTSGVVTPSSASGIISITKFGVTNSANANAFKVVKSYDSTADKDILTITGTANDSFDIWIEGKVA